MSDRELTHTFMCEFSVAPKISGSLISLILCLGKTFRAVSATLRQMREGENDDER